MQFFISLSIEIGKAFPNILLKLVIYGIGAQGCVPIFFLSLNFFISHGSFISNAKWVVRKHSKKYTLHALWFDCNFAPHNNQTE